MGICDGDLPSARQAGSVISGPRGPPNTEAGPIVEAIASAAGNHSSTVDAIARVKPEPTHSWKALAGRQLERHELPAGGSCQRACDGTQSLGVRKRAHQGYALVIEPKTISDAFGHAACDNAAPSPRSCGPTPAPGTPSAASAARSSPSCSQTPPMTRPGDRQPGHGGGGSGAHRAQPPTWASPPGWRSHPGRWARWTISSSAATPPEAGQARRARPRHLRRGLGPVELGRRPEGRRPRMTVSGAGRRRGFRCSGAPACPPPGRLAAGSGRARAA